MGHLSGEKKVEKREHGCFQIKARIPFRDVHESHTHICLKLHFWWLDCGLCCCGLFCFVGFQLCSEAKLYLGFPIHRTAIFLVFGFLGGSVVKNPPANSGDIENTGLIPGSGRSSG